jgi:putative membrane-bound dehydrogenase-like protein
MRRLLGCLLLTTYLWSLATAQPVPTKDAAAKMKLPPGFKVQLFAGEPDVVQPIAFTFDDRGRMWVVECLMYPKWSQDGKGGKDRVIILEDTDGDGKHDKKTVVLDDGVNLSGIELGFGGVYLCSSPNLLFVPIKDDKPAGKPEVLLDGWNIKDAKHNVFNSLIWGPDGWLYGCNGIQTKSKVGRPGTPDKDRIFFDCGVWRFHPTRKVFEVVANGTTNPWGLDFDEHGEMFITNCVIDHLFHVVPGGHYTRMHGTDPNPHTYGYMGSAVDYKHWGGGHWTDSRFDKATGTAKKEHDDAGGGHAHSGCAIYLGDNFPKEYRNTLFTCNIHGNRLNNDGLERTKTGMKGVRRPDFLFANDPWFRGICVKQGPAGELFVSDWCDTGECHNYDVADTTNGRIYRITYGDLKPWSKDVSKMSDEELVKAVVSPNEWLSRKARRLLQERAAKGEAKASTDNLATAWLDAKSTIERLRICWALNVSGGRFSAIQLLLAVKDEEVSHGLWAIRLTGDEGVTNDAPDVRAGYHLLAASHADVSSPQILRALANELRKYAEQVRNNPKRSDQLIDDVLQNVLLAHDADPDTLQMFWYAIEAAGLDMPQLVKAKAKQPLLYEYLARKLVAVADKPLSAADGVLKAVPDMPSDECRAAAMRGLTESLRGAKNLTTPQTWYAVYGQLSGSKSADVRKQLDELGLLFGDEKALAFLRDRTADVSKSAEDRIRAVSLLSARKTSRFDADLRRLLADPAVRAAAIRGLANFADDATPAAILGIYAKLTPEEKADAVQTLSSRATYAAALLAAMEKGTVPKGDITAFTARQIVALKDKSLADKLKAVWGEAKPANTNRAADIAKYKSLLKPDYVSAGDLAKGKVLFAKHCGTCHKLFGEGQAVGPELTGSQRSNLDYVLENVVDPNAVVPFDYKMTQFFLKDGRQVSGLVRKDTPQAVTVRTVNEEVVFPVTEIDERKPTNSSVMPEGLFDALKPEEVRDLVKYLMSK